MRKSPWPDLKYHSQFFRRLVPFSYRLLNLTIVSLQTVKSLPHITDRYISLTSLHCSGE